MSISFSEKRICAELTVFSGLEVWRFHRSVFPALCAVLADQVLNLSLSLEYLEAFLEINTNRSSKLK